MGFQFIKPRKALVEELHQKGIQNPRVLEAIERVERHRFVQSALHPRAYEDTALPIGKEQTISQPYTVARQTELLDPQEHDEILEIGTGSGYQAAVLAEMGVKVHTVERHPELSHQARTLLSNLGYRIKFRVGDGTRGWSAFAPYDAILVTAGAPDIPENLLWQLKIGGRLVIPVGDRESQKMYRIIRSSEEEFERHHFGGFKFVPLIGNQGWRSQ